jgi:hypothetical protein
MTKHILPQEKAGEIVVTACPVCKGTSHINRTFCFKCNGRGILMRPALAVECQVEGPDGILEDLSAISEYLSDGGTMPSARRYFKQEVA